MMLFGIYQFYLGQYLNLLLGALCLFLWDLLDCVDGDLATVRNQTSEFGAVLEELLDRTIGKLAGFLGLAIAYGMYRATNDLSILVIFILFLIGDYIFFTLVKMGAKIKRSGGNIEQLIKQSSAYSKGKIIYEIYYWELQVMAVLSVLSKPFRTYLNINIMFWGFVMFAVLSHTFWVYMAYAILRHYVKKPRDA